MIGVSTASLLHSNATIVYFGGQPNLWCPSRVAIRNHCHCHYLVLPIGLNLRRWGIPMFPVNRIISSVYLSRPEVTGKLKPE
jgi:hypothetical protein